MKILIRLLLILPILGCSEKEPLPIVYGTFKDSRDQHEYKSVIIGTQTWMAENLAYLPYVSEQSEGDWYEPDTTKYYFVMDYFGSDVSDAKSLNTYETFGVYYSKGASLSACPAGWHLPSLDEWRILEDYLGSDPGYKLKSIVGWDYHGNGNNSYGFNARPGGKRLYALHGGGWFDDKNLAAWFWSSTSETDEHNYTRETAHLTFRNDGLYLSFASPGDALSIRCVKSGQ